MAGREEVDVPEFLLRDSFDAFLFDMDGTLLSSIKTAERVWSAWAVAHGLDPEKFLPTIHGVQTAETIRRLNLPGVDPAAEAEAITRTEMDDMEGIDAIAGTARFLASLPPDRWAVVTSASRRLALRRLEATGLPMPRLLIAAEEVPRGKPAPDCFLLAADRLGVSPTRCVVFEDAAAGIAAGEAAGCTVVVITATHRNAMATAHRTVPDFTRLRIASDGGAMRIALADA